MAEIKAKSVHDTTYGERGRTVILGREGSILQLKYNPLSVCQKKL
jgi:hypothetical protein